MEVWNPAGSTLWREQERGSAIGGSVLGTWAYITTALWPLQPTQAPITAAVVSEELEKADEEGADKEGRQIMTDPLALPDSKNLFPRNEIIPPCQEARRLVSSSRQNGEMTMPSSFPLSLP